MKKILALLAAAVLIVAAAGCVNKVDPPAEESDPASQASSDTVAEEETGSVSSTDALRETVIVTDAKGNSHVAVTSYSRITQYTTRAPSPNRLTTRPTTTERTTMKIELPNGVTTRPNVPTAKPKPTTTAAPTTNPLHEATTAPSFKEPVVDYGGVLGTQTDSVRIKSHTVTLSQNNSLVINLTFEILACSGTTDYIYIGYDCYDESGNKINAETVRGVAPVRQNETQSVAIVTAPINTAKIVFKNI